MSDESKKFPITSKQFEIIKAANDDANQAQLQLNFAVRNRDNIVSSIIAADEELAAKNIRITKFEKTHIEYIEEKPAETKKEG